MIQKDPKKRPSIDDLLEEELISTTKKRVKFDQNVLAEEEKKEENKKGIERKKIQNDDGDGARKWNENGKQFRKGAFTLNEIEILKHALCRYVQVKYFYLLSTNDNLRTAKWNWRRRPSQINY